MKCEKLSKLRPLKLRFSHLKIYSIIMFTHSTMNIGQLKRLIILIIMFGKAFHHSILNWTEQFSSIIKQIRIPSCNAELWLSGRRMLSKIIKWSQMLIRCLPHPRTENFFNSTFMDFKSSLPPHSPSEFGSSHGELPHFVCTSNLVTSSHKRIRTSKFSWRQAFCVDFRFQSSHFVILLCSFIQTDFFLVQCAHTSMKQTHILLLAHQFCHTFVSSNNTLALLHAFNRTSKFLLD